MKKLSVIVSEAERLTHYGRVRITNVYKQYFTFVRFTTKPHHIQFIIYYARCVYLNDDETLDARIYNLTLFKCKVCFVRPAQHIAMPVRKIIRFLYTPTKGR